MVILSTRGLIKVLEFLNALVAVFCAQINFLTENVERTMALMTRSNYPMLTK